MTPEQTAADNALVEKLEGLRDARDALTIARERMNAAIPPLTATPAELSLYDERYVADHAAERTLWDAAIAFADTAGEAAERIKSLQAEVERLTHDLHVTGTQYAKVEADRQRMREALEAIGVQAERGLSGISPAVPMLADIEHRSRQALNPASKEANDG